ncbi:MAG TPA: PRC-barrel domain-containing protein, partial [Methanocorpusculum sp.]|nr:PRC-barrel domain-containing protein [Methanocorpusculum sp.]
ADEAVEIAGHDVKADVVQRKKFVKAHAAVQKGDEIFFQALVLFLGKVEDVVLDVTNKKISGLALTSVNQNVLDIKNYQGVVIPYRIVKEVGDIILVRHIPGAFKVSEPLFGE